MDFYLSASNDEQVAFRNKVDRVYALIRGEGLGALIKSHGFDADGDALLEVAPQAVARLEHIASVCKVRLWKEGRKQRG